MTAEPADMAIPKNQFSEYFKHINVTPARYFASGHRRRAA
jgi:hypothetical protein